MTYPAGLRYTKDHEWLDVAADTGRVGITDYAQQQLGDVVFMELPEVGKVLKAGQSFGTIESVKAVSELYAPVSGEVVEVNEALKSRVHLLARDPGVRKAAATRADVQRLWEACQLPDYRKLSPAAHADLVQQRRHVLRIGQRDIGHRILGIAALPPTTKLDRDHAARRRQTLRQCGVIARVAGQAREAQQRQRVAIARIVARVEADPIRGPPIEIVVPRHPCTPLRPPPISTRCPSIRKLIAPPPTC